MNRAQAFGTIALQEILEEVRAAAERTYKLNPQATKADYFLDAANRLEFESERLRAVGA